MKEEFYPSEYLARVFALDSFEQYCVQAAMEAFPAGGGLTAGQFAAGYGLSADYHPYFWPESRLMRYFLLRTADHTLSLDPRIAVFLEGNLAGYEPYRFLWRLVNPEEETNGEQRREPEDAMERFYQKNASRQPVFFHLYGNPGIGRSERILDFCRSHGHSLLILDSRVLFEENEEVLWLALRECRIYGAFLMIRDLKSDWFVPSLYRERLFLRMAQEAEVVFSTGTASLHPGGYCRDIAFFEEELPMPGFAASCALWEMRLSAPDCGQLRPEEWANKFVFTPGQMSEALGYARRNAFARGREQLTREDLQRGCYHLLQDGMGKRAIRIEALYTWEELKLPPRSKQKLREALDQAACRKKVYETWGFDRKIAYGKGLSVVFAGPPGTGKTMAAQVMASELCLNLYRIDLAAVVSKYIGETEKNLEEIFEQAAKSQVILLFDEADVLFSKRTQVHDSNDKYSNMEAAFLLQKMEEYEGITVLATNFLQNFDEAFKRRMKFIIDFPFPDAEQRASIWKQVFPARTPVEEDLDYEFLASAFELSGSNIKNAALHAAFLAAARDASVSMGDIIAGIRNEFGKSGKQLSKEQLGQYYML